MNKKIQKQSRHYSITDLYRIIYQSMISAGHFLRSRIKGDLNPKFIERIMLAVTEVNGCAVCSYAHAKMALKKGMTGEEIRKILSGVTDSIPPEETAAILFSQHYAETGGRPEKAAWKRVVEIYGKSKAYGILAVVRMIMFGNAAGIPLSSFLNRFRGRVDKSSGLVYEISMLLASVLFAIFAMINALFALIFRAPVIKFNK